MYIVTIEVKSKIAAMNLRDMLYSSDLLDDEDKNNLGFHKKRTDGF